MPVRIVSGCSSADYGMLPSQNHAHETSYAPVRIGLVNNMPVSAFKATEHQFVSLLNAASKDVSIDLSLFVLRGTSLSALSQDTSLGRYPFTDELEGHRLDGLIVTGTEPTTAALSDEPYWQSFTQLVEWARHNSLSTIWSCLAAHAALLHMDGIQRSRSRTKHFGIFPCDRVSEHWLLTGAGPRLSIPHSRWNGIAESDLFAHEYQLLTRTPDGEVDTFVKQDNSFFIFFQGHPEYETHTLLREYRRDIGRYLGIETTGYPLLPRDYFDVSTERSFSSLQRSAPSFSRDKLLDEIATIMKTISIRNTWQSTAALMYSNWIDYLCTCKEDGPSPRELDISRAAS